MKALVDSGEANVLRLSQQLSERSVITCQALGWLAREGRIQYAQRGNQVYVSARAVPPQLTNPPVGMQSKTL